MAESAGPLVTTVLQRMRDPHGTANTREFVRQLLSLSQRLVNASLKVVLGSATLTTEPRRQVYPIRALLEDAAVVVGVREDGRDLGMIDWMTLGQANRQWPRATGPRFETYSLVGRDMLILHPGKDLASSVEVVYATVTADLASDSTVTELHDDFLPPVLDLTESILMIRGRQFEQAAAALGRVAKRFGIVLGAARGEG